MESGPPFELTIQSTVFPKETVRSSVLILSSSTPSTEAGGASNTKPAIQRASDKTSVLLCGGEVVGCIVWWEGFYPISGDNYTVYCLP